MRRTILIVGLVTYVVAWFLPVSTSGTTLASGRLPGWEALRLTLSTESGGSGWTQTDTASTVGA